MANIRVEITVNITKPNFETADIDQIIKWIKTNVMDKLMENSSASYTMHYTP